jgi:tetratricopeptide (TPR) repeat protein
MSTGRGVVPALLLLACVLPINAQSTQVKIPSPLSIEAGPVFDIPLGDSSEWFSPGGTFDLGVSYRVPNTIFALQGGLQYAYAPIPAEASVSLAILRAGGGILLPLTSAISLYATATIGYYFATLNDLSSSAGDPCLAAAIGLKFALDPSFRLTVSAQYKNYVGLYQGISVGAGVDVSLGNLGGSVAIPQLELRPAFPVFYKHYDSNPVGSLRITSNLRVPATDITTRVYIKEYMDAPKTVAVDGSLAPGQTRDVDLFALFNDKVLDVTEGTKVAAEITVSFKVDGQTYANTRVETLTLWGRNAMTWDDDRKAAAYVTAKDPCVLNFSRGVISYIRSKENRAINDNLQAAVAIHEALDLYGINYAPSPQTPYEEASKHKDVIDFLQFPRETIQYKAGDCSDLSILYAALLEAVGIDTAFITIPGHIFIAVDTGLTPDQAVRELIPTSRFISRNGRAWIPIEVTSVHGGFIKAWDLGAKEWNESSRTGEAAFYPIQEAWKVYQPVGLPGAEVTVAVPQSAEILAAYRGEVERYLGAALSPLGASLQEQIRSSGSPAKMNSLGVLYAKYGQEDKAEQLFKDALAQAPFLPALMNLGNLCFKRESWNDALRYYKQAQELEPASTQALLALARVNQELQKYDDAREEYDALKATDPELAAQFSYLGEEVESGTRAAEAAATRSTVLWDTDGLDFESAPLNGTLDWAATEE